MRAPLQAAEETPASARYGRRKQLPEGPARQSEHRALLIAYFSMRYVLLRRIKGRWLLPNRTRCLPWGQRGKSFPAVTLDIGSSGYSQSLRQDPDLSWMARRLPRLLRLQTDRSPNPMARRAPFEPGPDFIASQVSVLQRQEVCRIARQNAAEELAVCLAHVPRDHRLRGNLDRDIIPCGEYGTHPRVR